MGSTARRPRLNRGYVSGVQVFVDHRIAFGVESANSTIDGFVRFGDEGGYAGRWPVDALPSKLVPTISTQREHSGLQWAVHRVRSLEAFEEALDGALARIMEIGDDQLVADVRLAEVPDSAAVVEFLNRTRSELPAAVARLRQTI